MTTKTYATEDDLREALKNLTDKNIFLEAGAGAGKTSLIVERIANQIFDKEQGIEIDKLVVITFTEKAANELEERIFAKLANLVEGLDEQDEHRQKIERNKHLMFIGTIHSFCQKIIRERPLESEIPIAYTMDDEGKEQITLKRYFKDVVQKVLNENPTLNEALNASGFRLTDFEALFKLKVTNRILCVADAEVYETINVEELIRSLNKLNEVISQKYDFGTLKIPMKDCLKVKHKSAIEAKNYAALLGLLKDIETDSVLNKTNLGYQYFKKELQTVLSVTDQIDFQKVALKIDEVINEPFVMNGEAIAEAEVYKKTSHNSSIKKMVDLLGFDSLLTKFKDKLKVSTDLQNQYQMKKQQLEAIEELNVLKQLYFEEIPKVQFEIKNFKLSLYEILLGEGVVDLTKFMSEFKDSKEIKPKSKYGDILNSDAFELPNLKDLKDELLVFSNQLHLFIQKLTSDLAEQYVQERSKLGELSFNDLLSLTYKILQNEEARQFFHEKYKHLYVDEVQDTDALQMLIIFAITATKYDPLIENIETAPNSLFLVGDPKQSIYRFRSADLRIFDFIKKMAMAHDGWEFAELKNNFRSQPKLINWFNNKFRPKFDQETETSIQPNYVDMVAGQTELENIQSGVQYFVTDKDNFYENESQKIVNWIRENVGVMDIVTKEGKAKLGYKDILIILPKTTKMSHYLIALQQAGIPSSFSGRVDISIFKEIHRLMAIVRYCAHPTFDHHLIVKSICYDYLLSDLQPLKESWYAKLKNNEENNEAFLEVEDTESYTEEATLTQLRKIAYNLENPMSFVEYLIYNSPQLLFNEHVTETKYYSSLSILTTFYEKIRSFRFPSLQAISIQFDEMLNEGFDIEYEMSVDDDHKAVRLMNLHKSKGLEASVVILAGESTNKKQSMTTYIERENLDLGKAHYSLFKKNDMNATVYYSPDALQQFEEEYKRHEVAEFIRLLYVAATRAKQLLLIGCMQDGDKFSGGYWKELIEGGADSEITLPDVAMKAGGSPYYKLPEMPELPQIDDKVRHYNVSASRLDKLKTEQQDETNDATSFQIGNDQPPERQADASEETDQLLVQHYKGALWGNIIHELYEMAIQEKLTNVEDAKPSFYKKAITNGLAQYELTEAEMKQFDIEQVELKRAEKLKQLFGQEQLIKKMKAELNKFLLNEQLQGLIASGEAYTELHYKMKLTPENGQVFDAFMQHSKLHSKAEELGEALEALYVTGYIDLLIKKSNGIVIVDYKTNELGKYTKESFYADIVSLYTNQLKAYGEIAKTLFGDKTIQLYVYAVSTDELIEIT